MNLVEAKSILVTGQAPSVEELLPFMEDRVPYRVMQSSLRRAALPSFQAWEDIPGHLSAWAQKQKNCTPPNLTLQEILRQHLYAGEKAIRLTKYEATGELTISEIARAVQAAELPISPYRSIYPLPLNDDALDSVETGCFPVEIVQDEKKTAVMFCSRRIYREEVRLPQPEDGEPFSDFVEIFGIRYQRKQRFDVLVIDTENDNFEFRIDASSHIGVREMERAAEDFMSAASNFLKRVTNNAAFDYGVTRNFFPALRAFYNDKNCCVTELGFKTDGGAPTKTAKARRRGEDVRADLFHKGGSQAVGGNIDPYKITVEWPSGLPGAEVELPGTVSLLNQVNPSLTLSVLRGCGTEAEVVSVLAKLNSAI